MTLGTSYSTYQSTAAARTEAQDWLNLLGQPGQSGPLVLSTISSDVSLTIEGQISKNGALFHRIPGRLAACLLTELIARADTLLPAALARLAAEEEAALLASETEVTLLMTAIEQAKTDATSRAVAP